MKSIIFQKNSFSFLLIAIVFLLIFPSCAGKKPVKPDTGQEVSEIPVTEEDILDQKDIDWSDQEQHAMLYKILMQEAEKYLSLGEKKKVFALYDRALTIAAFSKRPILENKINELFSSVDIAFLEDLYDMGTMTALEPFLIYEMSLRYIIKKKYNKAKQILSSFEQKYQLNELYEEACGLLDLSKQNMFNKDLIGCLLPLSGRYGKFGQRALNGIELALKDFQEKYNKHLVILVKDTGGEDQRAVECVKELCEKKVSSIIGPMVTALSVADIVEKNAVPTIAMTQKKLNFNNEKYLFSNFITPELQTAALVSYSLSNLKVKKFAILYPNDKYGNKYMNLFWDKVDALGGEIRAAEAYSPKDTDFSESIKKLTGEYYTEDDKAKKNVNNDSGKNASEKKEIDFKAIFIPDISRNIAQILPQLVYHDIKHVYLLGTKLWHRDNLIEDAAGYNHNAVIMEGYFAQSKNKKVIKFSKDFIDLYGEPPGFMEAIAYDTASILFDIAGDDTINTKEGLRNQITGNKIFKGVTGNTSFDEINNLHKDLYYLTISHGKFVEIKR